MTVEFCESCGQKLLTLPNVRGMEVCVFCHEEFCSDCIRGHESICSHQYYEYPR